MPIPFRAGLRPFLTEFAEGHRGVRLGQMFGLPACYVGRRLFACLVEDGLIVRLPADVARREIQRRGEPYPSANRPGAPARARPLGLWVRYRPRTAAAARRLGPVLEVAARHLAERQMRIPNSQGPRSQALVGRPGSRELQRKHT